MQAPLRVLMFTTALLATLVWTVAAGPPPVEPTASAPESAATPADATTGGSTLQPETTGTGPMGEEPSLGDAPSPRSALMCDIMAVFDAARAQVEELEAKAKAAQDEMEFLSIQREIERLHRDTELRILQVQADHLRREGHLEAAKRIEAAIAEANTIRPAAKLVDRPAPTDPAGP